MKTGSAYSRRRAGERLVREAQELELLMQRLLRYGISEARIARIKTSADTLRVIGNHIADEAEAEGASR